MIGVPGLENSNERLETSEDTNDDTDEYSIANGMNVNSRQHSSGLNCINSSYQSHSSMASSVVSSLAYTNTTEGILMSSPRNTSINYDSNHIQQISSYIAIEESGVVHVAPDSGMKNVLSDSDADGNLVTMGWPSRNNRRPRQYSIGSTGSW